MSSMPLAAAKAPPTTPGWGEMVRAAVANPTTWIVLITLLGFFLRVWQLEGVPPGWRDDELIETLVISQNILDGDIRLYYPDASGHEPLYHMLNALFLAWFGPGGLGIRLASALVGTVTVPLTYIVGRRLFGSGVGLVAAAVLAVSFWGLMYARVGIRHVLTPPFVLLAFYFFWGGLQRPASAAGRVVARDFALAGLFLGLGFYVYFAGRGVPLVPLAFAGYLLLVAPTLLRRRWRGLALMAAVTLLVVAPLALVLAQQPEAEGRVNELALPLTNALAGDFALLIDHTVAALTTAHSGGDPEWLYNIPGRPIFGPVGAVFFWAGIVLAVYRALRPLVATARYWLRGRRHGAAPPEVTYLDLAAAFLLLWWLAGISPAILSVPEASLGHMIMAQSAFFLLTALPVGALAVWARKEAAVWRRALPVVAGLLLVSAVAVRDLPAYFGEWPERGMVRFLYRADIHDVAAFVEAQPDAPWAADFGITGLLAGPWDREALRVELDNALDARPRWYNPERVLLLRPALSFAGYPEVGTPFANAWQPLPETAALSGGYDLVQTTRPAGLEPVDPVCFANNLCWTGATYDPATGVVEMGWEAADRIALPPLPLISNPPPPGVYNGPRLYVFAHLVDAAGALLVGDDGLWVDPSTLYPGDAFIQQHRLVAPGGTAPVAIVLGLYDPLTGERVLTSDGVDSVRWPVGGGQ